MDWSKYAPYFTAEEFRCKHTGKDGMTQEYMDIMLAIRIEYGKSLIVTSGYRHESHPLERKKVATGEHPRGTAGDYRVRGGDAINLISIAIRHGINRIGIQQKGPHESRFVHLGIGGEGLPSPAIWSY
jgi:uncharacterized protein YcbK (DUF882 family)